MRAESHLLSVLKDLVPEEEWVSPELDLEMTPNRVYRSWERELLYGYSEEAKAALEEKFRWFPREGTSYPSTMVVEAGIPFTSLCAHHLLPFRGTADFGYIPKERVMGLSKVAWVLDHFAARLQIQERLTEQVLSYLEGKLEPLGSILVLRAEHLCMSCRGPKKPGVITTTAAIRGLVIDAPEVRSEFYSLIRG